MVTLIVTFLSVLALTLSLASPALACSVCFGGITNASALVSLKLAIVTLLVVLVGVLASFVWFFIQIAKRSKVAT